MTIFEGFLATPETAAAFGEEAFVAAMLRFEAALARAQAAEGVIPAAAADAIVKACDPARFDAAAIAGESGRAGSVAIPLVKALKAGVELVQPGAGLHAHFGSTSQDVIDTAAALVSRPLVEAIAAEAARGAAAALKLAETHAATPMLARTLGQPASVTSFGLKSAQWAAPLVRTRARLAAAAQKALAVQLGGAVGTQAQMKGKGPAVAARMAADLGLAAPAASWHTQRDEWVALACELGVLVGSLGKIAKDISLLGQFEVGEVAEPSGEGRGGSSAMPHKRNPVASMVALAAATRAPQRVAAMLAAMPQENERSLGAWQAELAEWPQLLMAAHGSARAMAGALEGLQVDAARMAANIEAVRAKLPADAAAEWFDPALAKHAAGLALAQVAALRAAR